MAKNSPASPMTSTVFPAISAKGASGVYDHNSTPLLSKPHSMGKDTIPLKFEESLSGTPVKANSPMDSALQFKKV